MTPYYADESVTLYHGDAVEVLHGLVDVEVAAVVFAERMRERGRWLKALDDSSLPHTYRRLLVVLALGRCDNCGGDAARCDCDES